MFDWFLAIVVTLALSYLAFLGIWQISKNKMGILFTNMAEGTGTVIMDGNKAGEIILAMKDHSCELVEEVRPTYNKDGIKTGTEVLTREKIIKYPPRYSSGVLGMLERHYGIYWVGLPPKSRMNRMFKWNEWKEEEVNGKTEARLWHREIETNFFFAQSFPYGIVLRGAECGGNQENGQGEVGGNLTVDLEIDLILQMVYPRVALFGNTDWFQILGSIVLDHARLYVGKHPYEALKSQASAPNDLPTHNQFSEYVMKLNEYASIGENYASVVDALGVKIIGAQIRTVSLSGASKELAEVTTQVYAAEQKRIADNKATDAKVYNIAQTGQAETAILNAKISAVKDGGKAGELVLNAEALTNVGSHGNTVIASGGAPFILNTNKAGGKNAIAS